MKKYAGSLLLGIGTLTAGATAVSATTYSATKRLVKIAMDREEPTFQRWQKKRLQISGTMQDAAFLEQLQLSAETLKNAPHEKVEITGRDGEKLVGHWFACEQPKRIVIAMHGWRSTWAGNFSFIADFLHRNGCSVLYAEQRGQGDSGGKYITFGAMERYDCLDWVDWVNRTAGTHLPVYLAGISMGATTVLLAAGLEPPENVRGIIADCGFTSIHAIWKHVADQNLRIPYSLRSRAANALCKKKIQLGTKDCSTVAAMRDNHIPVLFVHGTDDRFVPIEMTYENYQACAAPKQLLIVPGAGHGMSYLQETARYEKTVLDFWKQFDRF